MADGSPVKGVFERTQSAAGGGVGASHESCLGVATVWLWAPANLVHLSPQLQGSSSSPS